MIHDIPAMIEVVAPKIPPIEITGWQNIPKTIEVIATDIPKTIEVVGAHAIPKSISIEGASNIPTVIRLEVPVDFPKTIVLDASGIPDKIQVVGIPPVIELIGNIPTEIKLTMPEKPEVEMVYRGAPIEMKISLDTSRLTGEDQNANCVAIVPCKPS